MSEFYFFCFLDGYMLFSLFRFYGLYEIPDKIYGYVSLGVTSYLIGFGINRVFNNKRTGNIMLRQGLELSLLFYVFLYMAISITTYRIALMFPHILHGGISYARGLLGLGDSLNLPGIWNILLGYFAKPYLRAAVIIFCVDMVYNRITGKYIFKIMLLTVLQFFTDGGRSVIIHTFIAMIYLFWSNLKKINYKLRRKLYCVIALIVVMTILTTIERRVDVIDNLYRYYCGGLVYFARNLNTSYLFEEYLYGINSFQGILRPVFGVLNLFGIEDPVYMEKADDFIMAVQTTVSYVSPQGRMNYFITCFGYFYKDGGVPGIIIESVIFGLVCGYIERINRNKRGSYLFLSQKILFIQGILFTMSKYTFSDYGFVMTMIYIYLILKKRDKESIDFMLVRRFKGV